MAEQGRATTARRIEQNDALRIDLNLAGERMQSGIGHRNQTLGRLILRDKIEGRLQQINLGRRVDKERPLVGVIEAIQAEIRLSKTTWGSMERPVWI